MLRYNVHIFRRNIANKVGCNTKLLKYPLISISNYILNSKHEQDTKNSCCSIAEQRQAEKIPLQSFNSQILSAKRRNSTKLDEDIS